MREIYLAPNSPLSARFGREQASHALSEWSERYASGTRSNEPPDIRTTIYRAKSAGRVLGEV